MTQRIYDFEERRLKEYGDRRHLAVFNKVRYGMRRPWWKRLFKSNEKMS